uniref:Nucleotide-binding alpha-beta plait domain-containing protein n=1 Tax=Tanacetum cinerariifolium TaxID=118510 RepID=A0A6L2L099_TANCI|nr:nucleotide-binding alpha-beta plait domain-containing protein [Tanacetum cinerariifolium]
MGSYRTKEDDVARISTSVYITNFPDSISAKELFQACKQYGHVVDSFIPFKKSKFGKRFGFVRFIYVFSEERLTKNLCTVWIGRSKIHANIARFQRPTGKNEGDGSKKSFVTPAPTVKASSNGKLCDDKSYRGVLKGDTKVEPEERLTKNLCTVWIGRSKIHANIDRFQRPTGKNEGDGSKKSFVTPAPTVKASSNGKLGDDKSYRGVLKGDTKVEPEGKFSEPSIVLGDECVMSKNADNTLFGRGKEFASLTNLKMALGNEGFSDIVIKYMGELWIMLEFKSLESMIKFKECVSVMSWFSQVKDATNEFEVDGRIAWVEVKGVPYRLWTENTFARIADKWGKLLDVDDQDETCFHSKRLCVYMKPGNSIREDFKIIHQGKTYWIRANETQGWVPDFTDESDDEDVNSMDEEGDAQKIGDTDEHSDGERVPDSIFEDEELVKSYVDGKHSEKKMENSEDPFNLYSILNRQKQLDKKDIESDNSLKYPPGFTPSARKCDDAIPDDKGEINDEFSECCEVNNMKGSGNGSISSGHFKVSEIPRTGGLMVGLLEEVVKVEQVMRFKMEGCISNLEEIIGSQGVEEGYR